MPDNLNPVSMLPRRGLRSTRSDGDFIKRVLFDCFPGRGTFKNDSLLDGFDSSAEIIFLVMKLLLELRLPLSLAFVD